MHPSSSSDSPAHLPHIVGWTSAHTANTYYRVTLPLRSMDRNGLATTRLVCGAWNDAAPPGSDVLVVHRNGDYQNLELIRAARRRGSLVVADEDDLLPLRVSGLRGDAGAHWTQLVLALFQDPEQLPTADPVLNRVVGQVWEAIRACATTGEALRAASRYHPLRVHARTLREAHLVTTASRRLAEAYRALNPSTSFLPNCLDLTEPCYRPAHRHVPHEGIIIGWAGGREHAPDVALVAPVIAEIVERYDGRHGRPLVRLMLGGALEAFEAWSALVPGVRQVVDNVRARARDAPWIEYMTAPWQRRDVVTVECGRHLFRPSLPVTSYPLMYQDVDIGIVPNCLTRPFSAARSDVKGLEMAAMGVPIVASPIPEYTVCRPPGTGAWLPGRNSLRAWARALHVLVRDRQLRHDMEEEALGFARTRSIDLWAPQWIELYKQAVERV